MSATIPKIKGMLVALREAKGMAQILNAVIFNQGVMTIRMDPYSEAVNYCVEIDDIAVTLSIVKSDPPHIVCAKLRQILQITLKRYLDQG